MASNGYLLGYDIGSSSIKATVIDSADGKVLASATSPEKEMEIIAKKPGWAEQKPEAWWEHVRNSTMKIRQLIGKKIDNVGAIGISYQMHGLVVIDNNRQVLRPSIIWCDSRAVEIGDDAFRKIGEDVCLSTLLNSPGNFTASKLKWVMQNEPEIYEKIYKIMLPGDYIAMRMTDEICTTPSGLSEGIFWDFKEGGLSKTILDFYRITSGLIPKVLPTFSEQGELTSGAAGELGLPAGIKISYRSGDQPNNALSLKVMDPGEIASTAGTSGVVYGVTDKINYDEKSRVNTFVHVNHKKEAPRYGILLCLNGTGILNSWIKHNFMTIKNIGLTYREMDSITGEVPAGSEGLIILPYGNGAERTLENKNIGAAMQGLQFNIHNKAHFLRAAQEGIVFALNYGIEIMEDMGLEVRTVRAGHANMFLSPVFSEAFATITGANVELYNTDGSQGAARGAGIGSGIYRNYQDAFTGLKTIKTIEPVKKNIPVYRETYNKWKEFLESRL